MVKYVFVNVVRTYLKPKTERMLSKDAIRWKEKAVERNAEIKELKKRLKETRISRDNWKSKCCQLQNLLHKKDQGVETIKKALERMENDYCQKSLNEFVEDESIDTLAIAEEGLESQG